MYIFLDRILSNKSILTWMYSFLREDPGGAYGKIRFLMCSVEVFLHVWPVDPLQIVLSTRPLKKLNKNLLGKPS